MKKIILLTVVVFLGLVQTTAAQGIVPSTCVLTEVRREHPAGIPQPDGTLYHGRVTVEMYPDHRREGLSIYTVEILPDGQYGKVTEFPPIWTGPLHGWRHDYWAAKFSYGGGFLSIFQSREYSVP